MVCDQMKGRVRSEWREPTAEPVDSRLVLLAQLARPNEWDYFSPATLPSPTVEERPHALPILVSKWRWAECFRLVATTTSLRDYSCTRPTRSIMQEPASYLLG